MITFGDFMAAILNDNDGFKAFMCLNGPLIAKNIGFGENIKSLFQILRKIL